MVLLLLGAGGTAHGQQKCEGPDGSVTYAAVCPAGTKHVPSTMDPPAPPQRKGTVIVKPDPLQGFKPVPRPEVKPPAATGAPAPPAAPAGRQVKYYDIEAHNETSLLAALEARQHHAESSWRLVYEFKPRLVGSRCGVGTVSTALQTTITLPRWNAPKDADHVLVERWQRYVESLRRHEEKRLEAARELETALGPSLMKLELAPTCEALNAAVSARYETLLAQARSREADFAARSRDGGIEAPHFR